MDYREAGTGGIADSTVRAKASAMVYFLSFLKTKQLDYTTMNEEELCVESLFRQFGTYLITTARVKNTGKLLKRDTAVDYFSGVVQVLKRRFKRPGRSKI